MDETADARAPLQTVDRALQILLSFNEGRREGAVHTIGMRATRAHGSRLP